MVKVKDFECDHEFVCKRIEMDGCLRCAYFEPITDLIYKLKHTSDEFKWQDLIVDFMEEFD